MLSQSPFLFQILKLFKLFYFIAQKNAAGRFHTSNGKSIRTERKRDNLVNLPPSPVHTSNSIFQRIPICSALCPRCEKILYALYYTFHKKPPYLKFLFNSPARTNFIIC